MKKESLGRTALGVATGVAFGVLLQKGRTGKVETIRGQFLLRDFTVLQIMGTAVVVGAVGAYALERFGVIERQRKAFHPAAIAAGGALFGAGMATFGYCPGTSLAALGEGKRDALAGLLGMLVGAAAFIRLDPVLRPYLEREDADERTLPEMTNTSPYLWLAGTAATMLGGAAALEATG